MKSIEVETIKLNYNNLVLINNSTYDAFISHTSQIDDFMMRLI
jgi:hypothetical protein